MTTTKAEFTNSILIAIEQRLKSLSFKKRRPGFSKALEREISGYIGLPVSTHPPQKRIGVSAVVGVVSKTVEDAIRRFSCNSRYVNELTLSTQVGYITPEARFLQWVFDPDLPELISPEIEKIVRAISEYGLPFMREHVALESIIAELENKRFTSNSVRRYRLPVAYLLAGQKGKALQFVREEIDAARNDTSAAAQDYEGFAQRLREAAQGTEAEA